MRVLFVSKHGCQFALQAAASQSVNVDTTKPIKTLSWALVRACECIHIPCIHLCNAIWPGNQSKPLEVIYGPTYGPIPNPVPILNVGWSAYSLAPDFRIVYTSGKSNVIDPLSRFLGPNQSISSTPDGRVCPICSHLFHGHTWRLNPKRS